MLDAAGSADPDADKLKYEWMFYHEAGTYKGKITIKKTSTDKAAVQIPNDAKGKTIHIVLIVTDNGEPNLTRYQRLVIECRSVPDRGKEAGSRLKNSRLKHFAAIDVPQSPS